MKILKLRFKNLNSLAGEWSIDFTDPEYQDNGIFAIFGPTGSGKTTILDAICLALYGKTPRLDKISTKENDIMTHGLAECFSEVEFETRKGRYISQWSQKRSRGKADGKLQSAKWEVAKADDQQILSEKIKDSQIKIEELTGMNFERFTRSIMLAQGEFSKFLKSGADQRSPILEQITGTSIYSEISRKVYERWKEEHEELKGLNLLLESVDFLSDDEKEKRQKELEKLTEKLEKQKEKISKVDIALAWFQKQQANSENQEKNHQENEDLILDFQSHENDLDKKEKADKALLYSADWKELLTLRQEAKSMAEQLAEKKKILQENEPQQILAQEAEKKAQITEKEFKIHLQKQEKLFQQVREIDLKLLHQSKELKEKTASFDEEKKTLDKNQKQLESFQKEQKKIIEISTKNRHYLEQNSQDQNLNEALLKKSFAKLKNLSSAIKKQQAQQKPQNEFIFPDHYPDFKVRCQALTLEEISLQIEDRRKFLQELTRAFELDEQIAETQKNNQIKKENSQKIAEEGKRENKLYEALEANVKLQAKLDKFKAHRHELIDGQACPLCGSLEHPLFDENEDKELSQKFTSQEKLVKKLRDQYSTVQAQLKIDQKHLENLQNKRAQIQISLEKSPREIEEQIQLFQALFTNRLQEQEAAKLRDLENEKDELLAETLEIVQPYFSEPVELSPSTLTKLQKRRELYQKTLEVEQQNQQSLSTLTGRVSSLNPQVEHSLARQVQEQELIKQLQKVYQNSVDHRQEIFADKKVDDEEKSLKKQQEKIDLEQQKTQKELITFNELINSTKIQIKDYLERQSINSSKLNNSELLFVQSLENSPFSNEEEFVAAQISQEEHHKLKTLHKKLYERKHSIETRKKELEDEAKELQKTKPSRKELSALQEEKIQLEEQKEQWNISVGAHQQALKDDAEKRLKEAERARQKESQEKRETRWRNLNSLIGSADGKKFRNYAQGITFEILISHANVQLQKMSDRYVLVRDLNKPLDLNVLDNYQAGEERSCRNLSGGESFIVSLALALGLSKMASEKISVDTLFLDEGFGTLDENILDDALETLASLQHEGKLIGLISHISSVKERISSQIHVYSQSNGHSNLEGPGIKKN